MMELSQQIYSYVVVIDKKSPTTATPTEMQGATQSTPGWIPLVIREVPIRTSVVPRELTTWLAEPFSTFNFLFF